MGRAELGDDLPAPKRAMPAEAAYLVTSMLQGVIDHGTAAASRSQGVDGPLAGKTGTTNDRRDNWFAGYSPDRVSIVWVGYDDNSPTAFSGASAALPIWSRFTAAVRPAQGVRRLPAAAGDRQGDGRSDHRPARHRALPLPRHRAVRRVEGADRALPAALARRRRRSRRT